MRLGTIGFLTTALFVSHLAMQIPGGRLVDRHGARTMGTVALVIVIAGNALGLVAGTFSVGVLARLVTGLITERGVAKAQRQRRFPESRERGTGVGVGEHDSQQCGQQQQQARRRCPARSPLRA